MNSPIRAVQTDVLNTMAHAGVTASLECRRWMVRGTFYGLKATFQPITPDALLRLMVANSQDKTTAYFLGREREIADHVMEAIKLRLAMAPRTKHFGRTEHDAVTPGGWGEYRVVTDATALHTGYQP